MLAAAAGLEGFEFVHELEELTVLGGLVAGDLVEFGLRREDAKALVGLDLLLRDVGQDALGEGALAGGASST